MKTLKSRAGLAPLAGAVCAALLLMAARCAAQAAGDTGTTLGDLARQQRRKEQKQAQKPAKVFTNDDISTGSSDSSRLKPSASSDGTEKPGEKSADDSSDSGPHDEAYFRNTMKHLREKLAADKARLAELCSEMDAHEKDIPLNAVVLRNPNRAPLCVASSPTGQAATVAQAGQPLAQKTFSNDSRWQTDPEGSRKAWEGENQVLADTIRAQKTKIARDEKAISDFVDRCRRENCEPGWIR